MLLMMIMNHALVMIMLFKTLLAYTKLINYRLCAITTRLLRLLGLSSMWTLAISDLKLLKKLLSAHVERHCKAH